MSANKTLWVWCAAILLAGCERAIEKTELVPEDQVPALVMEAAQKRLPDVKFDSAWKTKGGGFEVRGKASGGKVRDVHVSEQGKILEVD